MEAGEGLEHVKSMHVHNGSVNCELRPDIVKLKIIALTGQY